MGDETLTDRPQIPAHQHETGERFVPKQEPSLSTRGGRRSQSFLVRVWAEPRGTAESPSQLRAYVRDLRTGEESYLDDPAEVGSHLSREIGGTQPSEAMRNETDGDDTHG